MKKSRSTIPIGQNQIRVIARLDGDDCEARTHKALVNLMDLVKVMLNQPDTIQTGSVCPDVIRVTHNGSRWVLEAEAIIDREDNGTQIT